MQRLKETIIEFTSSYWVLTVPETSGLGEALGPLGPNIVSFVVEFISEWGRGNTY